MPGELDSTEVQLARFFGRPVSSSSSSSSTADATASLAMADATSNGARDSLGAAASPDVTYRFAKRGSGSRRALLDLEMSG